MPYTKQVIRNGIDGAIDDLVIDIRNNSDISKRKGTVNYAVTRVALNSMKPSDGWSYSSLSDTIAALRDAAAEIERRLLGPYEDMAKQREGDLEEFAEHNNHDERGFTRWVR